MENNFNNNRVNENNNKVAEAAVEVMEAATKQSFLKSKTGKIVMIAGAALGITALGAFIYRRCKKAKEATLVVVEEQTQEESK